MGIAISAKGRCCPGSLCESKIPLRPWYAGLDNPNKLDSCSALNANERCNCGPLPWRKASRISCVAATRET